MPAVPGFPPAIGEALGAAAARWGRSAPGHDAGRPPLAALDWDNTCIFNDVGDAAFDRAVERADIRLAGEEFAELIPEKVGWRLRRAPIAGLLELARAGDCAARREFRVEMLALYEDLQAAFGSVARYRWIAAVLGGRTEAEVEALGEETIERGLAEPLRIERLRSADGQVHVNVARGLRIYAPMAALLRALAGEGWLVRIVTASLEPLVRAFARRVGLGPECVIGVRLERDQASGRLAPRVVEPFPYGEGKLLAIERFVGRRPHLVAGDSPGDIPLLRASQDARLVVERVPASQAASLARSRRWLVVHPEEMLPPADAPSIDPPAR